MRVVVFLELAGDMRIAPELDARSGRVREEWLVHEIDPASARALELALGLRAACPDTEVTLVHLGSSDIEPWFRQALARGCDRAFRVWDEETIGVGAAGKAVILTAAAENAGFDLILAGASGVVSSSGQFGVLLAQNLQVPCVTQAVGVKSHEDQEELEIERILDRGLRERVAASLPLVVTVSSIAGPFEAAKTTDMPVSALLDAYDREITVWDLADLGVPQVRVQRAERSLVLGPPQSRCLRLHRLAAPDPALPAFDRILELVRGSVSVREGRVVEQPAEGIVDEIFATLKDEGWLDHLKNRAGRETDGDPGAWPTYEGLNDMDGETEGSTPAVGEGT